EMSLQIVQIEMLPDALLRGPPERNGIDDAITIELVADHRRSVGNELRQEAHDRGVGGAEQHGRLTPMKLRKPALERDMGRPRAADEAHGPRASAVLADCLIFSRLHLRIERQPEIAIRIHAQEWLCAVAFQKEARSLSVGWRNNFGDDRFVAFQTPGAAKL